MHEIERSPPNSDHLRSFVAIADCGNLTQAAQHLNRTQSAISVQLRKLEQGLNAVLFDRHARGMTLTASGETFLPAARRALMELERATQVFAKPLAGRLRVGLPDDFDDTVLEHALAAFSARHPGIEIVATSGCTSAYREAVRRRELDLAISSGPAPQSGDPLIYEPTVWACAPSLALLEDEPLPLALLDRACWWQNLATDALNQEGRRWRVVYKSASFASVRAAVRAGLALAPLPARSVEPDLRLLGAADGMPPLPAAHRTILLSDAAPRDLADAMSDALRQALIL